MPDFKETDDLCNSELSLQTHRVELALVSRKVREMPVISTLFFEKQIKF